MVYSVRTGQLLKSAEKGYIKKYFIFIEDPFATHINVARSVNELGLKRLKYQIEKGVKILIETQNLQDFYWNSNKTI